MEIFVQTLAGSRKVLPLTVDRSDTIDIVKVKIQKLEKITPDTQRLYLAGRQLEDGFSLAYYDVEHGSTLVLVRNVIGRSDAASQGASSSTSSTPPSSSTPPRGSESLHRRHGDGAESARQRKDRKAASKHDGPQTPERGKMWHDIAEMEKRDAAFSNVVQLMRVEHQKELQKLQKTLRDEANMELDAAAELAQLEADRAKKEADESVERLQQAHTAELERSYANVLKLSSEVTGLTSYKLETEPKVAKLTHVVAQLKAELVAMRDEQNFRDMERDSLVAILKEDKRKYKDERNSLKDKLEYEMQKTLCQICFSRPRDSLIFPCSHLQYCFQCLQQHQERNRTCPTCRASISSVLKCNVSIS